MYRGGGSQGNVTRAPTIVITTEFNKKDGFIQAWQSVVDQFREVLIGVGMEDVDCEVIEGCSKQSNLGVSHRNV